MNDVPFLTCVSHNVHCGTMLAADNLKCPTLEHDIRKMIRSYSVRGFNIVLIAVDIKLKILKDLNQTGVKFNIVSKEEHAPTIKRHHRVIEKIFRCCHAILPFKIVPRQMMMHFLKAVVFCITTFV